MQIPLKITYRHVQASAWIDEAIRRETDNLERFFDRITSCRVVVSMPNSTPRDGTPYSVQVDLTLPGKEIVVSHHHRRDPRLTQLDFAIDDAFSAARRMLEDYVRERRGVVKGHEEPPHGRVSKFFPEAGYGFIETPEGDEIYLDIRSVIEGADKIAVGTEVRFVMEQADKGPNATSVRVVGRHHHLEPVLAPSRADTDQSDNQRRSAER